MSDRYAVFGNPIAHSKSPEIHAAFARQTGQDITYERLLAPVDGFADAVRAFIGQGGRGANVTLPFKLDAHALATQLSERAQAAGAVNTLIVDGDAVIGDNTDGCGLVADISDNAGAALHSKRILLVGAGGAARGVILPLLQQQPRELVIANRTLGKAEELVERFGTAGMLRACRFDDLDSAFDVVINATSASLSAELPPLRKDVFGAQCLAYDMMYGKEPTVFMRFAAECGAVAHDGLGMLVEQAAESFRLWRGVRPDTATVLAQLRAAMRT